MNKKVWTAMLVLTVVFLCFLYIAKIFFPQDFVMCIENENLVKIGSFIDNHRLLYYIFCGITAVITYYLFCCACCHKKRLNLKEIIYIIITIIIVRICEETDKSMAIFTHFNISAFFILPMLMKGDLKSTSIVYFIHGLSQVLSLSIRNLPVYLSTLNSLTVMLLSIDMYFWLFLMYILFNKKEKEE